MRASRLMSKRAAQSQLGPPNFIPGQAWHYTSTVSSRARPQAAPTARARAHRPISCRAGPTSTDNPARPGPAHALWSSRRLAAVGIYGAAGICWRLKLGEGRVGRGCSFSSCAPPPPTREAAAPARPPNSSACSPSHWGGGAGRRRERERDGGRWSLGRRTVGSERAAGAGGVDGRRGEARREAQWSSRRCRGGEQWSRRRRILERRGCKPPSVARGRENRGEGGWRRGGGQAFILCRAHVILRAGWRPTSGTS